MPGPFPLVELSGASVVYGGQTVLDKLYWRIMPGQHWAVLGQNGAGKTTLLRLLRGEIRPYFQAEGPPAIRWALDGAPDASPLAIRPHSSMLSAQLQRHYVRQGWRLTGEDVILSGFGDGYMLYDRPSQAEREAVHKLAARLGAAHLLGAQATEMSQGQLRLTLLARALVKKPRLLVLDEPCDGLDEEARQRIFALLDEICAESTIICAVHKGDEVPGCLTHALELAHGKIIQSGPLNRAGLLAAPPARPPQARPAPPAGQVIFTLNNADVYLRRKKILHSVSWQVKSGENWLLSGPNGAGKSTLLRLLTGEEQVALGGSLEWFGRRGPVTLEERQRYTGYVSDALRNSYGYDLSGRDLVLSGLMGSIGLYRAPTQEEEREAHFWLEALNLAPLAHKKLELMSEGVARRFLLARALAPRPKLLILDEPCSGLDGAARAEFMRYIPLALQQGSQLIFVSHSKSDRQELAPLLTHELRLKDGQIEYCGEITE